jgi:hypothetical protein
MGFCERKVILKEIYGSRTSKARRIAQEGGTALHKQFYVAAHLDFVGDRNTVERYSALGDWFVKAWRLFVGLGRSWSKPKK